jgi:membrane fusion protein (multidrug efflux system)
MNEDNFTDKAAIDPMVRRSWRGRLLRGLLVVLILGAGVVGGLKLWRYLSSYVSTEDAQISGYISPVSSRIDGTVVAVLVHNTQSVKAGQLLVRIDPRDYQVAVEQARANLAQAQAMVATAKADQLTASSRIEADQANYAKAAQDVPRLRVLSQRGAMPRENYLEGVRAAAVARANIAADRAAANAALKTVLSRQAAVLASQAALDHALLELSYTQISAPVDGVVGDRTVQVGERVQPGQGLLSITQLSHLWVTANFKEGALGKIHPGQPATVHVDALGVDLPGYVEGLGGATGSLYSLLPPENATGNWIKVVQRVPVRVGLSQNDAPPNLRPGLSVEVKVWLR